MIGQELGTTPEYNLGRVTAYVQPPFEDVDLQELPKFVAGHSLDDNRSKPRLGIKAVAKGLGDEVSFTVALPSNWGALDPLELAKEAARRAAEYHQKRGNRPQLAAAAMRNRESPLFGRNQDPASAAELNRTTQYLI